MSEDRSDEDRRLSVKVMIECAEALLKDLKRIAPEGNLMTSRQLLKLKHNPEHVQIVFFHFLLSRILDKLLGPETDEMCL